MVFWYCIDSLYYCDWKRMELVDFYNNIETGDYRDLEECWLEFYASTVKYLIAVGKKLPPTVASGLDLFLLIAAQAGVSSVSARCIYDKCDHELYHTFASDMVQYMANRKYTDSKYWCDYVSARLIGRILKDSEKSLTRLSLSAPDVRQD